jgi:hypothetical protein
VVRYPGGVTSQRLHRPSERVLRRAARALAVAVVVGVTSLAGTAFADPPATWQDSDHVSPIHALVVYLFIPLGLFLLITLFVYLPSMRRSGESYQPGQVWRGEPTWFGGPRKGVDAVDETAPVTSGRDERGEPVRGGASGHW